MAVGERLPGELERFAPASWAPRCDPAALARVVARLEAAGVEVGRGQPFGALTTLAVGGPAAALAVPAGVEQVVACLAAVAVEADGAEGPVPVFVLGKGSNTLVADAGFPGLVLRLGRAFKWIRRPDPDEPVVAAGAAEAMPALAAWAGRAGLAGLEFAAGIPATVGGSVRMNAGAHGGQTADALVDVELATADGTRTLPAADLGASYRHTRLPAGSVVLAARWRLRADDPAAVRSRLDALRAWRRATQPLRERNCGSVFTNPEGDSAGRLVETAGGKGLAVGGARVSAKHANFVTTGPAATAADVHDLIAAVRARVVAAGGPLLEPEVRLVGAFSVGSVGSA